MPFKFLIALIAFFVVAMGPARAANPPEVQVALEHAAKALNGYNDGVVMVSETIISDLSLEIRYKPMPGVVRADAAERAMAKSASWAKAMCASSTIPAFLRRTGTTLSATFEAAPGVYEVQSKVEPTTCPEEAPPQVRSIKGKPLYPRPSHDVAMAMIMGRLRGGLLDFDSAKIECSDVSQALAYKPVLQPRVYGYIVRCNINAKNAFGGYTGYKTSWYYFNGPIFDEIESDPSLRAIEP